MSREGESIECFNAYDLSQGTLFLWYFYIIIMLYNLKNFKNFKNKFPKKFRKKYLQNQIFKKKIIKKSSNKI